MIERKPKSDMTVDWLLLIPTELELNLLQQSWNGEPFSLGELATRESCETVRLRVELCGFGLVVSAAQTMNLIAQYSPSRVLLCGIAGTYGKESDLGQAFVFSEIACYGIGLGCGLNFQSAAQMGWHQWAGNDLTKPISDQIALTTSKKIRNAKVDEMKGLLLSVTAASVDLEQAQERIKLYPDAVAEDMEGFGAAVACQLSQTPLTIVRGISNVAGERNKMSWKVAEAMESAAALIQRIVSADL